MFSEGHRSDTFSQTHDGSVGHGLSGKEEHRFFGRRAALWAQRCHSWVLTTLLPDLVKNPRLSPSVRQAGASVLTHLLILVMTNLFHFTHSVAKGPPEDAIKLTLSIGTNGSIWNQKQFVFYCHCYKSYWTHITRDKVQMSPVTLLSGLLSIRSPTVKRDFKALHFEAELFF